MQAHTFIFDVHLLYMKDSFKKNVGFTNFIYMFIKFCLFPHMLLDMLTGLSWREKVANIKPDANIDAFVKVSINKPCLNLVDFLSLFFISNERNLHHTLRLLIRPRHNNSHPLDLGRTVHN